jgi:transcriptional regulator with XRE-family HTH domain
VLKLIDCRGDALGQAVQTSSAPESFHGLLLRHRGRTGLIQRDLAARAGVSRGAVQDWEAGLNYPTAERLQVLIQVLLEAGGLTLGQEAAEARALWAATEREAPRMHTPFDEAWLAALLAAPTAPPSVEPTFRFAPRGARAQDWGEAPDTVSFIGRSEELALLRRWVLDERCRLVAVLGMGGIGKTSLTAKLAHEVAASFERVFWRSLRDALPVSDWPAPSASYPTNSWYHRRRSRSGSQPCWSCCVSGAACWCSTTPRPCSNQVNARAAIEQVWLATVACSAPWAMPHTRAASW